MLHGFAGLVADAGHLFASAAQKDEALEKLLGFALDGLCGRTVRTD